MAIERVVVDLTPKAVEKVKKHKKHWSERGILNGYS